MRRAFRVIIPILLIALILSSVIWYAFIYDRTFTRDLLLNQARFFANNGNKEISSWFYDLAYEYSSQDENVAIELANQFKAEGNYTKAEFTLSRAIADGGTTDLYMALCKLYVEQDKLMDAVNMLDNIPDPAIKAELDALRPTISAIDPAPGFYSQYISVTLESSGTLYYSTSSEYPSVADVPYAEPLALPIGETTIYAVAVSDNGLVSPLSILGYTIGGVIEEVSFADDAIEREVRAILGADEDAQIYTDELWDIVSFIVPADAKTLDDLSRMSYLESLTISDHKLDSLDFLSGMSHLTELKLTDCQFSTDDIEAIASLPALQQLTMSGCSLSTVAGLDNANGLTYLDLSNNSLRNLEPMSGLTSLKELNLNRNAVTDLSALSSLTGLEKLHVAHNALTTTSPVAGMLGLTELDVSSNALIDLTGVDKLINLAILSAAENDLTDVSILASCVNLTNLDISKNTLTDITALGVLGKLENFNFSNNQVTALPAWSDESALYSINGANNGLTSIDSLKNLGNLAYVYMDYNQLTNINALEKCYNLVQVDVYGNQIKDVSALKTRDVIVNHDPTV